MKSTFFRVGTLATGLSLCYLSQAQSQSVASLPGAVPQRSVVRLRQPLVWRITGRVVGETGQPIPGVNITARGTTSGTTTVADGTYSLSVPETAGILVFSSVGFTSQEIAYSSATVVNATLVEDIRALSEVVVTGYTTEQKKRHRWIGGHR